MKYTLLRTMSLNLQDVKNSFSTGLALVLKKICAKTQLYTAQALKAVSSAVSLIILN